MKVAITGGAGFLGVAFAHALRRDGIDTVVGDTPARLVRCADELAGVEQLPMDYADPACFATLLAGADTVLHLASSLLPSSPMEVLAENSPRDLAASLRLFEAARRQGLGKVIFASSGGTIYGDTDAELIPETQPARPISGYGASKLAIEAHLALYGLQGAFTAVSLRIGNPFGPFQLRGAPVGAIANFARRLRDGQPLNVWGDGNIVRDYLYIDDLAGAVLACLRADGLASGPYNIGLGAGYSINEIIAMLSAAAGVRAEVRHLGGRACDVRRIVLDTRKFRAATGWAPKSSVPDGIAKMWESCLADPAAGMAR